MSKYVSLDIDGPKEDSNQPAHPRSLIHLIFPHLRVCVCGGGCRGGGGVATRRCAM